MAKVWRLKHDGLGSVSERCHVKVKERIDPEKLSSALHVCGGRSSITHDTHHTTLITTFKEASLVPSKRAG